MQPSSFGLKVTALLGNTLKAAAKADGGTYILTRPKERELD
jgi:hypothetical protein